MKNNAFQGKRVTVMGLGLFGGGVGSARFSAERGAQVTVTDKRGERDLTPSIQALGDLPIRYVLGRHEVEDFRGADIVVVNPGVPADSPLVCMARGAGAKIERVGEADLFGDDLEQIADVLHANRPEHGGLLVGCDLGVVHFDCRIEVCGRTLRNNPVSGSHPRSSAGARPPAGRLAKRSERPAGGGKQLYSPHGEGATNPPADGRLTGLRGHRTRRPSAPHCVPVADCGRFISVC